MPTKQERQEEIDRLQKLLKQRDELIQRVAVTLENMEGVRDTLGRTRDESVKILSQIVRQNGKRLGPTKKLDNVSAQDITHGDQSCGCLD